MREHPIVTALQRQVGRLRVRTFLRGRGRPPRAEPNVLRLGGVRGARGGQRHALQPEAVGRMVPGHHPIHHAERIHALRRLEPEEAPQGPDDAQLDVPVQGARHRLERGQEPRAPHPGAGHHAPADPGARDRARLGARAQGPRLLAHRAPGALGAPEPAARRAQHHRALRVPGVPRERPGERTHARRPPQAS